MKRLLSLFLALALLLPTFGGVAFAEDLVPNTEAPTSEAAPLTEPSLSGGIDYEATIDELLGNISAAYIADTSAWFANPEWVVMDLGAYEKYAPETKNKLDDEIRQKYINYAIRAIATADENTDQYAAPDSDIDKAFLGLVAIGKDPTQLYPVNSNNPFSAIDELNGVSHSTSVWSAPYTLAVYNQGDYDSKDYEDELIDALLGAQTVNVEDGYGYWDEWGTTVETTANVLAGLAFYSDREDVAAAIKLGVNYLATQQNPDGTFSTPDWQTGEPMPNSNATAMVVIGLAAAGVNLAGDERFTTDEDNSILDGLLSFALEDKSGFGYTDNLTLNAGATEQSFRALIAAAEVLDTGASYNVYDFSENTLTPARETGESAPSHSSPSAPSGDDITVTVTIKANTGYWLKNESVRLARDGATVYDAFVKACDGSGITCTGAERGYVSSITKRNVTLAELDYGKNSGWLYKVNDTLPSVGLTEYKIYDGDEIVWYYTEDWTRDPSASQHGGLAASRDEAPKQDETPEETPREEPSENEMSFEDIPPEAWYYNAVKEVFSLGLMRGVSEQEFAPDMALSRAMLVTVLYRLAGEPDASGSPFEDVSDDAYYKAAVAWAYENGIVTGTTERTFSPDLKITREQLAAMVYRYLIACGEDEETGGDSLSQFSDSDEISAWAAPVINWILEKGIMSGKGAGLLDPQGDTTRAEVCTVLLRIIEMIK